MEEGIKIEDKKGEEGWGDTKEEIISKKLEGVKINLVKCEIPLSEEDNKRTQSFTTFSRSMSDDQILWSLEKNYCGPESDENGVHFAWANTIKKVVYIIDDIKVYVTVTSDIESETMTDKEYQEGDTDSFVKNNPTYISGITAKMSIRDKNNNGMVLHFEDITKADRFTGNEIWYKKSLKDLVFVADKSVDLEISSPELDRLNQIPMEADSKDAILGIVTDDFIAERVKAVLEKGFLYEVGYKAE
jgi:hypothetical protein